MLILTGGLGQEPIVLDTALHGLVPVDRAIVSASSAARVVVATRGVVTLGVTVPVVGAADSATASSVTEATVVDLRVTEDVVALVGSLGPIDPPIVGVTAGCGLGGHLWQDSGSEYFYETITSFQTYCSSLLAEGAPRETPTRREAVKSFGFMFSQSTMMTVFLNFSFRVQKYYWGRDKKINSE